LYCATLFSTGRILALYLLLAGIITVGAGTSFYLFAFFVRVDAQSALVFVFVPLYQLLAAVASFCAAYICWLRSRR
jgi:hypothetical protein